jgi:folate-binding protein YgfZ
MIVPRQTQQTVLARLDQFLFSEDVQLGDVTGTFAEISIVGPRSRDVVAALIGQRAGQALDNGPDHGLEPGSAASAVDALLEDGAARVTDGDGEPAILVRTSDLGEPGYSLLVAEARKGRFVDALGRAGVAALDAETADTLRIEGGIPRFGTDMDEETIPLEAGIESRAISLTKGCYVGQEVIVRVLHRGHGRVARRLVGLTLPPDATVPVAGVPVLGGERDLGRVTSASWSPRLERPIALAYVHRDFVAPGTTVTVDGREATVTALPFVEARQGEPADKRAR